MSRHLATSEPAAGKMSETVPSGGVSAPAEPALSKPGRMANIDRLRLLALLEIVAFHTIGKHILGGIGLPIFLLFTVALNARPRPSENGASFVRRKAAMFLIPWAAWSVVYAAIQTAAPLAKGSSRPFAWFEWEMLFLGTQTHLWYLIFALIASLAAFGAYRVTAGVRDRTAVIGGVLLACVVMLPEPYIRFEESWQADWLLALPTIPLGLALGRCIHAGSVLERRNLTLLLGGLAIPTMALIEFFHLGYNFQHGYVPRFSTALIPICIVVLWPGCMDPVTRRLTGLRLGVYLSHMVIIGGLHFIGEDTQHGALRSAVVIVGSLAITWVIMQTPLRWMVQPNAIRGFGTSRPAVDGYQRSAGDSVVR